MADDEFPTTEWEALREAMESSGPEGVIAHIETYEDALERRKLYGFCQRAFAHREWAGKDLDRQVAVVRAGIAEALRQADAETDPADAAKRTDFANVLSYNLAANLADCWPDADLRPERRHFEEGLRAARDCVRWREELDKGPFPFSIAYWAKGMHEISLGETGAALESLRASLRHAREHAASESGAEVDAAASFGVALGLGYVGIAEHLNGADGGAARYEEACAAFETMAQDPEKKDDAEFGLAQLRCVWSRYAGS